MRRLAAALLALTALTPPLLASADEGMWTFDRFPTQQVEARHGFRATEPWLESLRLASARIAQGCSASFVSADGLVMTNHHCVHTCVEELSTGGKDLVADGFLARTRTEERKCPALEVNQLVAIADVTARVKAATKGLAGDAFKKALDGEKARIEKACQKSAEVRCEVVTLFQGGDYDLYTYRRHQDVRLVFVPEFAIAFFGGDPDNFEFPRWDLDLAFVRVYEGGKPLRAKRWFRWSAAGAKAGELTFVAGNPGSTARDDTLAQLAYLRELGVPERIGDLSELRGRLAEFQRRGEEEKRISTSELFYTENSLKVYRGLLETLTDPGFRRGVEERERALRAKIARDPALAARADAAYETVAQAQVRRRSVRLPYAYLEKSPGAGSKLLWHARHLVRGAAERARPNEDRLPEYADSELPELEQELFSEAPVHARLETLLLSYGLGRVRERLGPDHAAVKRLLGTASPEELAAGLVSETKLADPAVRRALWQGGAAAVDASADPLIAFVRATDADARAARKVYEDAVEGPVKQAAEVIAEARFAVEGTSSYPDATFTPRVSFGAVAGWTDPVKGEVPPFTTIAGAYDRHTGKDPFALPPSWLAARSRLDLATPMNLVTTNDIIGGNSGSPMVNRDLEIVGLVFDGNLHSIAGDYFFDPALNRTVAVDSRAILEALRKVYGAERLADELRPAATAKR